MRVFVLNTGRCGSTTFIRACEHIDNFTAAHESRVKMVGPARFDYPDRHIEADNRMAWFLGQLGRAAREDDYYVWLRRDPDEVAESFLRRWESSYRAGIIGAFAHGILMQGKDWPEEDRRDVCRFYIDTVEANIGAFLESREHARVQLHTATQDFRRVWDRIGAEGDLAAALGEWEVRYNASV